MHRLPRTGLVLCAIALLLAACSGSGGSTGTSGPPVPQGLGGPGHHKHHHKGGKHGHHHKQSRHHRHRGGATSSAAPSPHPGSSTAPVPGRTSARPGTSTAPQPHPTTSATHRPPPTGPRVTVTPHTGLSSTQTVTVEGWGFTPNTTLAVAECHDRGTQTGLPDCNINNVITYSPGKKVQSDGNGHVGPVQIVVAKTFKSVNCGQVKCLVAISEPRLDPNPADEGDQYIKFA